MRTVHYNTVLASNYFFTRFHVEKLLMNPNRAMIELSTTQHHLSYLIVSDCTHYS